MSGFWIVGIGNGLLAPVRSEANSHLPRHLSMSICLLCGSTCDSSTSPNKSHASSRHILLWLVTVVAIVNKVCELFENDLQHLIVSPLVLFLGKLTVG